jgi:hypothetical protein
MWTAPLHFQKSDVWTAICQRRTIGKLHALSYSLFNRSSGHLTAVRHQQAILKPFVNQLHDNESVLGYFQQDGATAHSARTTIAMLRESFDNRFINRNKQNI